MKILESKVKFKEDGIERTGLVFGIREDDIYIMLNGTNKVYVRKPSEVTEIK